ncbi:MAG TPA: efflux RND transporter periplasmic adaptor subunit, partial [bacterium]|nr:efflux RND transporter periplasmic adaptor subunit [bacterium]
MRAVLQRARIAVAGVAAVAAGLTAGCGGGGDGGGGGGGGGGFEFPPTAVETATVEAGSITSEFQTVGSIEAREAVEIVSEIAGTVVSLPFREGDPIEKGAVIAQLDDAELAAELSRAEALRDQTKVSFDRVRTVVEQGAAAQQDLDDAGSALKVAEANVALARARLAKTRIVAPFSGVIGPREVSPGAFLRSGEVITRLAKVKELDIVFSVPERHAGELRRGAEVTVSTAAYPGYRLTGEMDVIDPILDSSTRSVRVIARVSNPDGRFRPGMSADIAVVLAHREETLTVASEAVFAQGAQFLVYRVQEDGTVAAAPVVLGARTAAAVEIAEGLAAG